MISVFVDKNFSKTPLGETGCLCNPYLNPYPGCIGIQLFDSPPYPSTVSQAAFGYLPLTVLHLCELQDTMPNYWSPSAFHPILPREAEDFPRGGNHSKHVPLLTYLA